MWQITISPQTYHSQCCVSPVNNEGCWFIFINKEKHMMISLKQIYIITMDGNDINLWKEIMIQLATNMHQY